MYFGWANIFYISFIVFLIFLPHHQLAISSNIISLVYSQYCYSLFYLNLDASSENNNFNLIHILIYTMNSPKENKVFGDDSNIPSVKDDETESVQEKPNLLPKSTKKTRYPEFSIDSLILRKTKDAISGNELNQHII